MKAVELLLYILQILSWSPGKHTMNHFILISQIDKEKRRIHDSFSDF